MVGLSIKELSKYIVPKDYFEGYILDEKMYLDRKVYTLSSKTNKSPKTDKTILYMHGGSYMAIMSKNHWNFLKNIVDDLGCEIIVPEYPLIPESNYKDVFDFVQPLYKETIEKIEPEKLILMGDSAGGGIALALYQKNGEEEIKEPAKLILISPWLDVRLNNPEIKEVQKLDKDLHKRALKLAGEVYAQKDGMDKYEVNPIMGPLDKLKNVTIFTGTYDILNPDVHTLHQRAKREKVKIDIEETRWSSDIFGLLKLKKSIQR